MSRNESFDDVLTLLMYEEHAPTDEALRKWSERYPQYRDDLADFFAIWAKQENSTEPEPDTDEDAIVEKSVKYAMSILERQGRLAPVQPVQTLSPFDELVLTAIWVLGGRGYPMTIALKVGEMQGKDAAMLGSIMESLQRLQMKWLALARPADPVTEPENQTRNYYTVTMAGGRALALAKEKSAVVARFLPDFA